jgi:hypothetical protein
MQKAENLSLFNPILHAAPTGITAHRIKDRIIHSLFRLPVKEDFDKLSNSSLSALQALFKNIHFLILDEKSMVGLKMFGMIDSRLREIIPQSRDKFIGGLNCLLVGDFAQLPPVL